MKLIHLSDLHLGKKLYEYSMIDDQKYILEEILKIVTDEKPDGVMIAGDVYDKSVPSAEAVSVFDAFVSKLMVLGTEVFVISGNHDSSERLAFGSSVMDSAGIHFSPVFSGEVKPLTLTDEYGKVNIYMLPFIKPTHVRQTCEAEIESYTDAMKVVIDGMNIDESERNVLITHQFVTDAIRSESENISVGGADNIDAEVFSGFDYVALGHLHSPQDCKADNLIRYCGTPLKYSFAEADDTKSVTVLEMNEKGSVTYRTKELKPLHEIVSLRGTYDSLMAKSFYDGTTYQNDYTQIILTDDEEKTDALGMLRTVYKNIMHLSYDNTRTRTHYSAVDLPEEENLSAFEIFAKFFKMQNGQEMSEGQTKIIEDVIKKLEENV